MVDKLIVRAALVAGSVILALMLMEAALAVFSPQKILRSSAQNIFFVKYDEEAGWVNKENAEGKYDPAKGIPETFVRINEFGMRGGPASLDKHKGVRRILAIGDSNTFGYGIDEEKRYMNILSGRILKNHEVLNMAVFGHGTDQEAILFEREGLRFSPDIVVLGFSAGDLSDNMSSINGWINKPFFVLQGDALLPRNIPVPHESRFQSAMKKPSAMKEYLYDHSHIYRLIFNRLIAHSKYMQGAMMEMDEKQGMDVTISLIMAIDEMCRKNNCTLVVVLIPHGKWVDAVAGGSPAPPGYFGGLQGVLTRNGVAVFDATPSLVDARKKGEEVFFDSDPVHITARGNNVVAAVLYRGLLEKSLIK